MNMHVKKKFNIIRSLGNTNEDCNQTSACCMLSCSVMSNSATPWTAAQQALLSMGFSRQEYWSGLPLIPPEYVPNPGIEPMSPVLTGTFSTVKPPGKPIFFFCAYG